MNEQKNDYCCTGYEFTPKVLLPSKAQLRALCDDLLKKGHKDAAIALDNAIDLIVQAAELDECAALNQQIRDNWDSIPEISF